MPWHGKPLADNLRATYRLWQRRRHPARCATCAAIWGGKAAPTSFEAYATRYPPLAHGAKRHLTLPWTDGLTVSEVASKAGCSTSQVRRAIANGTLEARGHAGEARITRTDATRWASRGAPAGEAQRGWISIATAAKRFLFSNRDLKRFIAQGSLSSKTGSQGAARGIVYVPAAQCARLGEQIGFTEEEAARRAGVPVPQFREALQGVNWRATGAIPLATTQAVIKRLHSRPGYTIEQAAKALRRDVAWVEDRIKDGSVRLLRRGWDADRLYLSRPMLRRLRDATTPPPSAARLEGGWLKLGEAAIEAGVTATTIVKWSKGSELECVRTAAGCRYQRDAVRTRARLYWQHTRFHRAIPPDWLQAETRT